MKITKFKNQYYLILHELKFVLDDFEKIIIELYSRHNTKLIFVLIKKKTN